VPESVLKAALLRRATEDIHRVLAVRSAKQALSNLLQKGTVGDDLWQRFLRAEKEIEDEVRDVVEEVRRLTLFVHKCTTPNRTICRPMRSLPIGAKLSFKAPMK